MDIQVQAAVAAAESLAPGVLQNCLIMHGAGGTLPKLAATLTPALLGLPESQARAMRGTVRFGEIDLLPKAWIRKLVTPRARVSSWLTRNKLVVPLFGAMIPASRWAPPDYDPSSIDWSAYRPGIYATFREVYDSAEWELQQVVEEICNRYDEIVWEKHNECLQLAQTVFDSIMRALQLKPDEFIELNPQATSNGYILTHPDGTPITAQGFGEMYWARLQPYIPTPSMLRQKARLYYNVEPVPLEPYQAEIAAVANEIFVKDLQEQRQAKLDALDATLATIMDQIYQRVVAMAQNLIDSIESGTGKMRGKTMAQLRGLITTLEDCNLLDDDRLSTLAAALRQSANTKRRDNAVLVGDLRDCLHHTLQLLGNAAGATLAPALVVDAVPYDLPDVDDADTGFISFNIMPDILDSSSPE